MKNLEHISSIGLATALTVGSQGCATPSQQPSTQPQAQEFVPPKQEVKREPDDSITATVCATSMLPNVPQDLARAYGFRAIITYACNPEGVKKEIRGRMMGFRELRSKSGIYKGDYIYCGTYNALMVKCDE